MLNDNAKAWIADLRSKQYEQGAGALRSKGPNGTDLFCCLGVGCETYNRLNPDDKLKVEESPGQGVDGNTVYFYDQRDDILPRKVADWLGLTDDGGNAEGICLTELNDSEGYTFEQIADLLESEPEGLFRE